MVSKGIQSKKKKFPYLTILRLIMLLAILFNLFASCFLLKEYIIINSGLEIILKKLDRWGIDI